MSSDVEKHLELGKKLLKEGKLSESLFHYSKAVGMVLPSFICTEWLAHSLLCGLSYCLPSRLTVALFLQRLTLQTTSPTSRGLQCSWHWASPRKPFLTWPVSSDSSQTSTRYSVSPNPHQTLPASLSLSVLSSPSHGLSPLTGQVAERWYSAEVGSS